MNRLCEFVSGLLKHDKATISQRKNKVIVEFDYYSLINDILAYSCIKSLVDSYPKSINIYMQNGVNEIDLVDYIHDKEEYNDELNIDDLDNFHFKIIIDLKAVIENIISINQDINYLLYYSELLFLKDMSINNLNYKDIEKKIFNSKKNVVILFDSNQFFYNSRILITNISRQNLQNDINDFFHQETYDQTDALELRNIYCNWINATDKLTPNDLYIDTDRSDFEINSNFKNWLYNINCNLVLLFISNFSGIDNGCYKSIINGDKRVEITYEEDTSIYSLNSYKNINEVYNLIYKKPLLDKLAICRNVIVSLISAKCQGSRLKTILENSDLLLLSFRDNYEAYCSGNINKYFNDKNELKKDLLAEIKSINIQIDNLIKLLITNTTSLIGISIAGVVGYIAKGEFFLVKLLSILYVIQLDINIILNSPINLIRFIESRGTFKIKANEYEKLYFSDNKLKNYRHKKSKDSIILIVYSILIIIMVIAINIIVYKIFKNKNFTKYLLELINRL